MDEDNLLDLMSSDDKPFKSMSNDKKEGKEENLYDSTDIKAVKVDPSEFKSTGKYFTIAHTIRESMPENYMEKILGIAKILFSKGYILRTTNDSNDEVLKNIRELEVKKLELFLPWKPKNAKELTGVTMFKPNKLGYGVAKNSHKIFDKLHPAFRANLSAKVHTLLGPDVNAPVKFVIGYNETGSEGFVKNMDFKKEGDLTFYFKVCGDSNIPIFNIKNDDAIKRLSEVIKKD